MRGFIAGERREQRAEVLLMAGIYLERIEREMAVGGAAY